MMKPYLLFAGCSYYPAGGVDDWIGGFDTEEDAVRHAELTKPDWWQVVEYRNLKCVRTNYD